MGQINEKHRINSRPIIHCPASEGVSEVSERANEWAQRSTRAKRARWSKRARGQCDRTSERTSHKPSTYISFQTIVQCQVANFWGSSEWALMRKMRFTMRVMPWRILSHDQLIIFYRYSSEMSRNHPLIALNHRRITRNRTTSHHFYFTHTLMTHW